MSAEITIMNVSIIVPVFNESKRLGKTLHAIDRYMQSKKHDYEIIVVDDGSDDKTSDLVREIQHTVYRLKLLPLPKHQGKGSAVKKGMLLAKGKARLFMDADGSTGIEEVEKLLPYLSGGLDVVVGSRLVAGAVKKTRQNLLREFLGWTFRRITHTLIQTHIVDTQNGFKVFSDTAAQKIFSNMQTREWAFDIEILVLAKKFNYTVKEVGIVWVNDGRSTMRFLSMLRMLIDLLWIRRHYHAYIV